MFKIDWDAVEAYTSPFILTVVALYAIWKDKKHYRERAWEESGTGLRRFLKRYSVEILYGTTLLAAFLGMMEIHGTRHAALQDKARALADERASEKQIADLQSEVKAGNEILQDQRLDFLKQFTQMSNRVTNFKLRSKPRTYSKRLLSSGMNLKPLVNRWRHPRRLYPFPSQMASQPTNM